MLEARVGNLERDLKDLRALHAEQTTQVYELSTRLSNLTGDLEELEHGQKRHVTSNLEALQADVTNLRRRVPPPAIVPVVQLESDEAFVSKLPPEASRLFGNGLSKLREGQFDIALSMFKQLSGMGAGRAWQANAMFWEGVCHDGLGDNAASLTAYHKLASSYPRHERAPLALLRQGSAFIRLGDSKTARLTFQKLIAEYPDTSEAARAKERIRDLK
jgi:TolA-binding protein